MKIDLTEFQGPLDLMLHLISKNKLDIFNLDLALLCDQYIQAVLSSENHKLSIASAYITEIAGLLELKSKRLLPKHEMIDEEDVSEENLVQRLLEYERFKEASQLLYDRFQERSQQFPVDLSVLNKPQNDSIILADHDIFDLIKAMKKVISRNQSHSFSEVTLNTKEYSIDERIDSLRSYLNNQKQMFKFDQLFKQEDPLEYKIVTFLAILDMIRLNELYYTLENETLFLKGSNNE